MNRWVKQKVVGIATVALLIPYLALAGTTGSRAEVVSAVMDLYDISHTAATERVAREAQAAELLSRIQAAAPTGYAGAWFDGDSLTLQVAISDPATFDAIVAAGAVPVLVQRSASELESELSRLRAAMGAGEGAIVSAHMDPRINQIVVQARSGSLGAAQAIISHVASDRAAFALSEATTSPTFSANVVGAEGTQNLTWNADHPGGAPWICSIGVSIEEGFVTAAHCGYTDDIIGNATGAVTLGTVKGDGLTGSGGLDGAWVQVGPSFTSTPTINGYSAGTITVPAKWSGLQEVGLGMTVCRYGRSSGGPYCGTVDALDQSVNFGILVHGLTRVTDTCTDDGDSGGPFLSLVEQVQGTTTGSTYDGDCPNDDTYVWFQPVLDTLGAFSKTMLTAHGANVPTAGGFTCPDLGNSGGGSYHCKIDHYNSQGDTSLQWSASSGPGSTSTELWGTCTIGWPVSVTLAMTNPYGTGYRYANFTCPDDPP